MTNDLAPITSAAAGFGAVAEAYDYPLGGTGLRVYLPNGYMLSVIPELVLNFPAGDNDAQVFTARRGVVELALFRDDLFVTDVDGFEDQVIRMVPLAQAAAILAQVATLPSPPSG